MIVFLGCVSHSQLQRAHSYPECCRHLLEVTLTRITSSGIPAGFSCHKSGKRLLKSLSGSLLLRMMTFHSVEYHLSPFVFVFVINPNGCGNKLRNLHPFDMHLSQVLFSLGFFSSMVQTTKNKCRHIVMLPSCTKQWSSSLWTNVILCGTYRPQMTKHGSNYGVCCTLKVNATKYNST